MPDAQAVEHYRKQGFWFPHRIMSADEAGEVARRFVTFANGPIAARYSDPQNQLYLLKAHVLFHWLSDIAHAPALLDAVEAFIGPDIMIWSSGIFYKPAHSGAHVSWHQDSANYELDDADKVVRAWVALTPATLENGTMHFLPRAHRLGQITHVDRKGEGELLSRGETIDIKIDPAKTVPVLIDAGEVSFHHLYTPHGSGPNDSDGPRVNYVITFIDPAVRPKVGPDSAMLARGTDRYGHFERERRPAAGFTPAVMVAHRRFLTMRNAILYRGARLPEPPDHPI